jgi:hypothetical protein
MDRELARQVKRIRNDEKRASKVDDISVGGFAKALSGVLMSDGDSIYNIEDDEVLEIVMEMREFLDDKGFNAACKKAVKSTKVKDIQTPIDELQALVA